ncbi:MAG: LysR family transcriptional regulator [Hyphomicrobiales bacterium]
MHLRELDTNLIVVLDALLIDASVTKAAERLGRSPSAISHALSNMREIFRDPLFVRAGQRLVPTPRAEQLAPTVHVIVSGIESLLRPSAPFDPMTHERNFSVACSEICELGLLTRLRHAIRDAAPNIDITRVALDTAALQEDLRLGKVQFVVMQGAVAGDAADFIWRRLDDEVYVTIAREGHPLAGRDVTKREFKEQDHILVAPSGAGPDPLREHMDRNGVLPRHVVTASSPFAAVFMALDTGALATVARSVAESIAARCAFAIVKQPFPPLMIANHLGWHRSHDRDECHEWVRDRIVELATGDTDKVPAGKEPAPA